MSHTLINYSYPRFLIISDFYSYYECNEPLLHRAELQATSYLRERGPQNAVLNGKYSLILHNTPPSVYKIKTPS